MLYGVAKLRELRFGSRSDLSRSAFASNDPISMTNPAPSGATPAPADAAKTPAPTPAGGTPVTPPPPRRGPGHRGQDVRDAVAEMAARAHEISLEAGSKMASAMKDVINAAAGLTAFALESARELVQYMVRRGQMTQDEADKLMRDVESAHGKESKSALKAKAAAAPAPVAKVDKIAKPVVKAAAPATPKAKAKPAAKPTAKNAVKKSTKKR